MMGVAILVKPGHMRATELQEFEDEVPSATFRREALGGEGVMVPRFITVTLDGVVYNCVAYAAKAPEDNRKNLTATAMYKQALYRQERKMKSVELFGPVLILYGDDQFIKKVRPQ
jgi:hypothetical protein